MSESLEGTAASRNSRPLASWPRGGCHLVPDFLANIWRREMGRREGESAVLQLRQAVEERQREETEESKIAVMKPGLT